MRKKTRQLHNQEPQELTAYGLRQNLYLHHEAGNAIYCANCYTYCKPTYHHSHFPKAYKVAKVVPLCKGKESPVQTCSISSYHKQSPREGSSRWSTCAPHSMLLISSYFSNRVAFSTSQGKHNSGCGPTSVIGLSAHQSFTASSLSSPSRPVSPQGSILGPALYTLFTCDFPEVVHEADCPHSPHYRPVEEQSFYRTMCTECGGLVCYADDSTYTVSANSKAELSVKMSSKFQKMSQYLKDKHLCINIEKTSIMVMCTEQRKRQIKSNC